MWITDHHELTPVERHGDIYIKRDDLFWAIGHRDIIDAGAVRS